MYNNSRRGGNQNNARRSGGKPNFVPGGQLTPQRGGIQQQQKPSTGGQAPAAKPQQQQNFPAPQTPTKQQVASNIAAAAQAPTILSSTTVVPPSPVEQKPFIQPVEPAPVKMDESQNGDEGNNDTEKKSWMNRKIPKREKTRRRNVRLSKLLQPKNAIMILHELVRNPTFNVVEHQGQHKAILSVAGIDHVGVGKSKVSAKSVASENAIKHLLRTKNIASMEVASEDDSEKMDTFDANESPVETPLPWQQVASFALYKLFDSWGENPSAGKQEEQPKKVKSAKKMPENPSTLNPVMVINQMYPQATFDELQPVGSQPNVTFKLQCNIDGQTFNGTGTTKKAAKKQAAYAACHTLMGINYPPEEYTPSQ